MDVMETKWYIALAAGVSLCGFSKCPCHIAVLYCVCLHSPQHERSLVYWQHDLA